MPFAPTDLSNIVYYAIPGTDTYTDTGHSTPATANNDAVAAFGSATGGADYFIQATGGNKPLLKTGTFGSNPSVLFDGTDDHLDVAHGSASADLLASHTGSHTRLWILKFTTLVGSWFSKSQTSTGYRELYALYAPDGFARFNSLIGGILNLGVGQSIPATGVKYVVIHTFNSSTNVEQWWVNGKLIAKAVVSMPSADTTDPFVMGNTAAGNLPLGVHYGATVFYKDAKTRAELNQLSAWAATWSGATLDTSDASTRFVVQGNSTDAGIGSTGNTNGYTAQLISQLGVNYEFLNHATPSKQVIGGMSAETSIKDVPAKSPSSRTIYLLGSEFNDLNSGGASAATLEPYVQAIWQAAKAAGMIVIATTLPPVGLVGSPETQRLALNTWKVSNWATYCDALCDWGNDPRCAGFTNPHHDDAEYGVMATILNETVASFLLTTGITVSGPSSGGQGAPSTDFTVTIASGETFDGDVYVDVTASNGTINVTATGTVTNNNTGVVRVLPDAGQTSFTFKFTPANAGAATVTYPNGQNWSTPTSNYTATDVTPPTLSSPVIPSDGTTMAATLSESGCTNDSGGASGTGGFTVAGTTATISSWVISGTTLTMSFNRAIYDTETVTLSYDRAATTDDIKDAAGNYLANFSGAAVTNNSTQPEPPPSTSDWTSSFRTADRTADCTVQDRSRIMRPVKARLGY